MGEGNVLGVNVSLCNSSKCQNGSVVEDTLYSGGLWKLSLLSCVRCWGVTMETQKHINRFSAKGHKVTQRGDLGVCLGLEVTRCELIVRNTTENTAILLWTKQVHTLSERKKKILGVLGFNVNLTAEAICDCNHFFKFQVLVLHVWRVCLMWYLRVEHSELQLTTILIINSSAN